MSASRMGSLTMVSYRDENTHDDFKRFHVVDHVVFFGTIIGFTVAGILIAYFESRKLKKQEAAVGADGATKNQVEEVLLGGRKMGVIPVALSLIGSYISGLTILGNASEIYNYGTQYMLVILGIYLSSAVVAFVFLPVFHELQVASSYEYLEIRFASVVRSIVSLLFVMDEFFFLPMVVHIPAIALSQTTGIRVDIIALVISASTVLYVLFGGMKAVIHTGSWQVILMVFAIFLTVLIGTIQIGGPQTAFKAAHEGGRLIFFNFNPALTERYTVWTVFFGGFMYWTSFNAVNQTMVQLYLSVATLRKAQLAILIFSIGISIFVFMCCYSGLLVYEKFHHCDPLSLGAIHRTDQLLPYYVMEAQGIYLGMAGLFVAAVFGAALSSLSVMFNCTALVIIEDICKGLFKLELSEKKQLIMHKVTVVVLGFISFALIFVLERLGSIFGVATALTSIAASVSFGMFTLGILVPWSNTYGTVIGAGVGTLFTLIVAIGTQVVSFQGRLGTHYLPMDTSGCSRNVTTIPDIDDSDIFPLFRLSFFAVMPIGMLTTVIVGTIASFITGKTDLKTLDKRLVSPVLHRFLPK